MLQGTRHHAGYGCNGFQHNCAVAIAPGKKTVSAETQKSYKTACKTVAPVPWQIVSLKR